MRKRTLVLLSSGALLLAVAGAGALLFQEPVGPKQRLPDGRELELVGTTTGTQHAVVLGNWWQRTVGRFIEDRLPRSPRPGRLILIGTGDGPWVDCNRGGFSTPRDELVLWFRVRRRADTSKSGRQHLTRGMTRDSHGCLLPSGRRGIWMDDLQEAGPLAGRPDTTLAVSVLRVYPRREARFEYALYDAAGEIPLAHFTIANPAPATPVGWQGAACPVQVTTDGLAATLDHLRVLPDPLNRVNVRARIDAGGAARPDRSWAARSLTVSDATGNEVGTYLDSGRGEVDFPGLCVQESPWRVGAELLPDYRAEPDVRCVLRDLPAPVRGEATPCTSRFRERDLEITATSVVGIGEYGQPGLSGKYQVPVVTLQIKSKAELQVVLLGVTDDRGRNRLGTAVGMVDWFPPDRQDALRLHIPELPGARRFDLSLGVTRVRNAEFLVKP